MELTKETIGYNQIEATPEEIVRNLTESFILEGVQALSCEQNNHIKAEIEALIAGAYDSVDISCFNEEQQKIAKRVLEQYGISVYCAEIGDIIEEAQDALLGLFENSETGLAWFQ